MKIWNAAIDKPTSIEVYETEEDVVKVRLAKENQWSISVRNGGHYIGGFDICGHLEGRRIVNL